MAKMGDAWDMNMGKCWENVGKMLGKWGCERDFNGISLGYS
jgi:hypothetical protein